MINLLTSELTKTDSEDEKLFEKYLQVLLENNIILSYCRCNTVILFGAVIANNEVKSRNKRNKKKVVINTKNTPYTLLGEKSYTPDYLIIWNPIWKDTFFYDYEVPHQRCTFIAQKDETTNQYYSVIDVKANAAMRVLGQSSSYTFGHNQSLMYLKYKIVVQKVQTNKLFGETFNPQKMRGNVKIRRRSLEEYLHTLSCDLD